jgi:hypothetical protein
MFNPVPPLTIQALVSPRKGDQYNLDVFDILPLYRGKKHTTAGARLEAIELVVSGFGIDVAIKSRTVNVEITGKYTLKEIKTTFEERKYEHFIVLGHRAIPLNYPLDLSESKRV